MFASEIDPTECQSCGMCGACGIGVCSCCHAVPCRDNGRLHACSCTHPAAVTA